MNWKFCVERSGGSWLSCRSNIPTFTYRDR